jgi:flagellar protein FliO/FliZ
MSPLAAYVVESLVTLLGVLVLAVVVLYGARRLGVGRPTGPLELVGRLPLEGRRSIYLVKVGGLVYVLGASEAGLVRLGELPATEIPSKGADPLALNGAFARAVARVTRRDVGPHEASR